MYFKAETKEVFKIIAAITAGLSLWALALAAAWSLVIGIAVGAYYSFKSVVEFLGI